MAEELNEPKANWFAARASYVLQLAQKWPGIASAILGFVAACGYPPLHGWWIALPALALFVSHLRTAPSARGAFWRGWVFGWAHLTLANNWIATSFTHQAKMPEALGWAAVPLLCLYLAVYPGLAALIVHLVARRAGPLAFGAVFAAAWIVTEWLRSWVFTGYPWPPLGLMLLGGWNTQGFAAFLPVMGTYALSGLAVILAAGGWVLVSERRWMLSGFFALLIVAVMLVPAGADNRYSDTRYTLVQPLITQDEINDGSKFEEQFSRLAALTGSQEEPRIVFWPEGTIPDYLEEGYPQRYYDRMTVRNPATGKGDPQFARERIGRVIGDQSVLLTGVVNLDIGTRENGVVGAVTARNSVIGIDPTGELTHHYAKAHLVPYGEYLPMEWALGYIGLSRLSAGSIPYDPGPGPQSLDMGRYGKAGVQICYEIVFSGQVVDQSNRPDYLFNPSNDGWFGTWGPPQHLAQARMRAIEEGLPVLRSTTTGISAVIDANGIMREHIPTGVADSRNGYIPLAKPPTLFAQFGNILPLAWAGILTLLGFGLPRLLALRALRR